MSSGVRVGDAYCSVRGEIEVAKSSRRKYRSIKRALYTECGVPEYWIVNLIDGVVEVHTAPSNGAYAQVTTFRRGERIRLAQLSDIDIAVDSVLPAVTP